MATANDDFNRADGALGAGWAGGGEPGCTIVSNQAAPTTSDLVIRNSAISTDDSDTSIEFTTDAGGSVLLIWSRLDAGTGATGSRTGYFGLITNQGSTGWISKWVTGSETQLVTASGIPALSNGVTYTLRLTCIDDEITLYVDSTQIAQVTDSAITTGKYGGFWSAANIPIDNFLHGDVDMPPPPPEVTFVAAGSFAGNITVATQDIVAPACAADDILICALINKSVTANAVTPPDGTWTAVIATEVNDCTTAADDHQYSLYWKRATGSGGTFTFTKATDDNLLFGGVIVAYRGCVVAGSPLDATVAVRTETAGAADNVTFPAYDPVSTINRVIYVAYYGNDLTTFAAAMSADTNPDCTKDCDVESALGNDCSIAITSGTNDGSAIAGRTWASASTTDAGNTGVVFALVAQVPPVGDQFVVGQAVQRGAVR